jgi:hypothetical protein
MEAQADGKHPNAKAEHLARMVQLHKKVSALYHTASKGGDEATYYATMFYVLEARPTVAATQPR